MLHDDHPRHTPGRPGKARLYADRDRKPDVLVADTDAIPAALRDEPRWVLWRLEWKKDRWAKVPRRPCRAAAKSNDPGTWSAFPEVEAAYRAGGFDGLGFVLGGGFVGVDLDDVRDPATGELTPASAELVGRFGTHTDVSPSGTGVKLVGRGEWPDGWHRRPLPDGGEVEGYSAGRYFTLTGRPVGAHPVGDVQAAADELAARHSVPGLGPDTDTPEPPAATPDLNIPQHPADPDDDLVRRAEGAANGVKFRRLWAGDSSDFDRDESRADLALCGMLAFWTGGDAGRVDRLFRRSGRMRPKWDRPTGGDTYGARTIRKALAGRTEFYRPAGRRDRRRPPGEQAGSPAPDPPKGPPVAEVLAGIGQELDLWHDPAGDGFATAGRRTYPIRGTAFRQWLVNEYRKRSGGRVPAAEAVAAAVNTVEARAVHDGPERPVFVRVGEHAGRVYLHLADPDATVIEVDGCGWRECPDPPVRFRSPKGAGALPRPVPGGALADLRRFLNVTDDGFALVGAWVVGCFRPGGPFPVLVGTGEQGSAKSTTSRVLKELIDPFAAPVRAEPREARDLMIQAKYKWVLAFDNLSKLPPWLSDACCRLATGGGFSTRALYTDDEEAIFDAKRPVILNGIEDIVTRADLLERGLLVRHPPIPDGARRPEEEFWAEFAAARPALLGAVLDRVSAALRESPGVRLDGLPRMADFARFSVAAERGAGDPPRFLAAYAENQAGAHEQALDGSPVAAALVALMAGRDVWEGTPADLLAALGGHAPDARAGDWPKKPNALTNRLRRLAPNLRRVYRLDADCDARESGGRSGGKRTRTVRVTRLADAAG